MEMKVRLSEIRAIGFATLLLITSLTYSFEGLNLGLRSECRFGHRAETTAFDPSN